MSQSEHSSQSASVFQLLAQEAGRDANGSGSGVLRGIVAEILETGEIVVQPFSGDASPVRCDFLETGQGPPPEITPGDLVLMLVPAGPGQNGCVLGRIGRYRRPETVVAPVQDNVIIEAGEMLTLLCGESSINLRKDGKLMIRGADVLSKAKGTQRIKGGTVAIN